MKLLVAVDFGTSSTCVVVSAGGRAPQVVVIDGHPLLPSAVYAAPDGTVFVGQEAERQAAVDPSRFEPHPKRRIDEGELLLGTTVLSVRDAIRSVLRRAVTEARRFAGGKAIDQLVLTHPADWGVVRTRVLRQAAHGLAREVALVPEPVAAAVFHAANYPGQQVRGSQHTGEFSGAPGDALAVLDLGGGTVDVSVVRRERDSDGAPFRVLATRGNPSFGGADIDQALLEHVGALVSSTDPDAWRHLMDGRELADRRRRRMLRQDVRGAKETLSRHAYTDVPMPPPFADAHVTRQDLEGLIAGQLGDAVDLAAAAVAEAGLLPRQLGGVFLVGGSSRIPLIARFVHERLGMVPTTLDQPETVVARGALRAVSSAARSSAPRVSSRTESGPRGTQILPPDAQPTQRVAVPETAAEPKRPRRLPWLVGGVVAAVMLVGVLIVALGAGRETGTPHAQQLASFAAFDYTFSAPAEWTQTDMIGSERRVVVRPSDAPAGSDLVTVQQFTLRYNVDEEPDALAEDLRRQIARAGEKYRAFDADATFAGRPVIYYVEPGDVAVDWFVVAAGATQVSVGCRYTADGQNTVKPACEQVVRTLDITG